MYQKHFSFEIPNKLPQKNTSLTPTPTDKSDSGGELIYFGQVPMQSVDVNVNAVKVNQNPVKIQLQSSTEERSPVWRRRFMLVFSPLLLWGFPIHLLFQRRRVYSMREWLKFLCPCSSPFTSIVTMLLAIVSIILNIIAIYTIGKFLHMILLTAVVSLDIMNIIEHLIIIVPVVIPLNLFWLWGYKLKNFISSFDRVVVHWKPINGDKAEFRKIGGESVKLIVFYGMIVCVHVLSYVSDYYHEKPIWSGQSVVDQVWGIIFGYSIAILNTLILPVYCCFCWAVKYELQMVREYIESLILLKITPKYFHFDEFKKISKKIGDDIVMVNSTFSILVSVVALDLGLYVYGEVKNLGTTLVNGIIAVFTDDSKAALGPEKVRLLIGDAGILLLYAALLAFTLMQVIATNDDMRSLHIWLNDFVTEPESRLSPELHDGYKLLKWYIHSRLEQEKPAFLSIMVFSLVPTIRTRVLRYRVLH